MQRVMTKDVGLNFVAGEIYDHLGTTWDHLARNVGAPLDSFSKPVDEAVRSLITKGKKRQTKRAA